MGTLKVNGDIHSTGLVLNRDWENNFGIRFREGGASNDYGAYIMYGLNDLFTFGTRHENNDLTAFSIHRTGNTVTFYGDVIMTSPKAIYTNSIIPNGTTTYMLGTSAKEYASAYLRQVFTRHIEPATNVNNDVYICYNNRGGSIRAYAPLDMSGIGSIVNLPIGGGLYWNPYVESSTDGTDAASITLHANGVGGGTELRITMANDGNDVINLNPASWVYLQGKTAFRVDDSWLRINETRGFSSGVYFGGSLVRTDSCLQVGDSGAAFGAYSDGTGYFANHLNIGSHVSIWSDSEGGNITLRNPNNGNNIFQFDRCFADGLRLYSSLDGGTSGTAEWAFYNDGRFQTSRIIGTDYGYGLRVQSLNRGTGAGWTEGIWVEPADNGYATLALGKTDRSSVIALVHHNNGNDHYLEKKNSRGQWTYQLPEVAGTLINSGNIGSQSVNYANSSGYASSAGSANYVSWGNVGGKPFGYHYFLGTLYNPESGVIVNCAPAASWKMITLHITGNGYGAGLPIDSWFQFYDYTGVGSYIINYSGINNGCYVGPLRVYIHGGRLWAWFPQPSSYSTISVELICNTENDCAMGHSYFHESGYTHLITINPTSSVIESYGSSLPTATHVGQVFFQT